MIVGNKVTLRWRDTEKQIEGLRVKKEKDKNEKKTYWKTINEKKLILREDFK